MTPLSPLNSFIRKCSDPDTPIRIDKKGRVKKTSHLFCGCGFFQNKKNQAEFSYLVARRFVHLMDGREDEQVVPQKIIKASQAMFNRFENELKELNEEEKDAIRELPNYFSHYALDIPNIQNIERVEALNNSFSNAIASDLGRLINNGALQIHWEGVPFQPMHDNPDTLLDLASLFSETFEFSEELQRILFRTLKEEIGIAYPKYQISMKYNFEEEVEEAIEKAPRMTYKLCRDNLSLPELDPIYDADEMNGMKEKKISSESELASLEGILEEEIGAENEKEPEREVQNTRYYFERFLSGRRRLSAENQQKFNDLMRLLNGLSQSQYNAASGILTSIFDQRRRVTLYNSDDKVEMKCGPSLIIVTHNFNIKLQNSDTVIQTKTSSYFNLNLRKWTQNSITFCVQNRITSDDWIVHNKLKKLGYA